MCLTNKALEPIKIFDDSDYDRVINGIISGSITTSSLDYGTYIVIATKLTDALFKGFGSTIQDLSYGSDEWHLLNKMRENVYVFSGAKTYQQTREISNELKKLLFGKSELNSLSTFKEQAKQVLVNYNENYLSTEYNFAISQGLSANRWQEIVKEKELYPNLTYHTVGDGRVRPEHASLDGVTRPINDSFWKKYFPPNGWNCRCTVMQGSSEEKITPSKDIVVQNVPAIFKMNAGIDKIVFSKKHPYFKVADQDKENAKKNWGLPIP